MDYTELSVATQDVMPNKGVLFFKSGLSDFIQVGEPIQNEDGLTFVGKLDECGDTFCPNCSRKLVKNGSLESTLKHVAIGGIHTNIRVSYARFRCLNIDCQFNTRSQSIPFKADGYRITKPLKEYTEKLLSYGLTLKAVAWLTGLDKMTVKSIHKSLLLSKFTTDGKTLIKPERQAKYLAIDEFKLHDGHKYATAIIDWETGYILYLAHGKKKAVVFEFMDHVGDEWMSKVEAVACDMNSDFEEAFKGRYPKLDIVYDRFHIIKNFNDKVVSEIRKDEQRRLAEEGSPEAAKLLKNSRYILMSKRSTLVQKDEDARQGKLVSTAGEIFNTPEIKAHGGNEVWYDELLEENKLFFTIDLVKDLLDQAYNSHDEVEMCVRLEEIIDICKATKNSHFIWFARLLYRHLRGIYTFAKYGISTGKLEGINNKIKTERRKGYGYPDDEYFFLRLMELSRKAS